MCKSSRLAAGPDQVNSFEGTSTDFCLSPSRSSPMSSSSMARIASVMTCEETSSGSNAPKLQRSVEPQRWQGNVTPSANRAASVFSTCTSRHGAERMQPVHRNGTHTLSSSRLAMISGPAEQARHVRLGLHAFTLGNWQFVLLPDGRADAGQEG